MLLFVYSHIVHCDFQGNTGEHEEIRKARLALEAVNKAIAAYEAEKQRLTAESELPGIYIKNRWC